MAHIFPRSTSNDFYLLTKNRRRKKHSTHDFIDLAYNTYLPHIVTIAYLLGLSLSLSCDVWWLRKCEHTNKIQKI